MSSTEVYQGDDLIHSPRTNKEKPAELWWSIIKKTLFIVGSSALIFAALSNTLTYHLQRFWGASGNFWQHQWENILLTFGDDSFNLFVYGSFCVGYIVYWGIGSFYTYMDISGKPEFLRRYKIQPGTNEPVERNQLIKLIAIAHFNQILSIPVAAVCYYIFKYRGFNNSYKLPTFHWVIFELAIFIIVEEICFYYSHRLLHHRYLYKRYHKLHHEWQSPIAVTAVYSHPVEHIFSNLLPIFAGPMIMGSHIATFWLWVSLAIFSTLNAHSGYHLPFFPSPEAHDFHHLKFNQCYGVLGVLDLLHGTDEKFRNTKAFSRHIMMLSLIPPREAFPDHSDLKSKDLNAGLFTTEVIQPLEKE
ncbi:Fatty acid hydroxylase domain-containing protein 2 [Armadillidium nasatum]|uniref:Fatty acid hydroxylase domain-containing protein 2 n=1 Tax=Armadillidium nasatum TaxID=96803 RepID=A0A5N5SYQ8_9CRUS|nr:Fatty acid hydroxylase domain-containing protein 2 [Armadillidium nasatum]